MNIYPSVLETEIDTFKKRLEDYSSLFPHIQIDIADGVYVDNTTISLEHVRQTLQELPDFCEDHTAEFHLMVFDPQKDIQKIKEINTFLPITRILLHVDQTQIIDYQEYEFEIGLVLNPEHSVEDYWSLVSQVRTAQIMTISPGNQGQPFLPETLAKISQLRKKGFTGEIILDGGMNEENLAYILKHSKDLPDAICPGSYFHNSIKENLQKLKDLTNSTNSTN